MRVDRRGNTAIVDTGTTLALIDDKTCDAIYTAIPGAKFDRYNQGWTYPANTTLDKLPIVEFAIGNKLFAIQKEDLGFADAGNGMIYGGIQSRGDMEFDILGDTFLKAIYAIFDQGEKKFGAVQRTDPNPNLATPRDPSATGTKSFAASGDGAEQPQGWGEWLGGMMNKFLGLFGLGK